MCCSLAHPLLTIARYRRAAKDPTMPSQAKMRNGQERPARERKEDLVRQLVRNSRSSSHPKGRACGAGSRACQKLCSGSVQLLVVGLTTSIGSWRRHRAGASCCTSAKGKRMWTRQGPSKTCKPDLERVPGGHRHEGWQNTGCRHSARTELRIFSWVGRSLRRPVD